MNLITQFVTDILLMLYQYTGNLGVAIVVFTLIIRGILIPVTASSLKASEKMKKLQPELSKLKKKHGKDAKGLQKAQADMYKKYNINPLAGCLPQLLQIAVLIVLYQILIGFLSQTEISGIQLNPTFLWLDLSKPDSLYILPVLAGITQLMLSFMIAPGAEKRDIVPNDSKKKKVKEENKKEEDFAEMASSMQQQMLYIMPVMTGFLASRFPAGIALYWVITTVFSIVQQWYISGPGGLVTYYQRAVLAVKKYTTN